MTQPTCVHRDYRCYDEIYLWPAPLAPQLRALLDQLRGMWVATSTADIPEPMVIGPHRPDPGATLDPDLLRAVRTAGVVDPRTIIPGAHDHDALIGVLA